MQKHILIFILFLGFYNISYSQFPVGKNMKIAVTELKQFLKTKGYNFLKTYDNDNNLERLDYSEEFSIMVGKNLYENVSYININTFKKKIFERLKTTFNFTSWTYVGELPNIDGELESIYLYKNYRIRIPHSDGSFQFIVRLSDE